MTSNGKDGDRRWIERRRFWTGQGIAVDRRSGQDRRVEPRGGPDRRSGGERRVAQRRSGPRHTESFLGEAGAPARPPARE